MNPAPTDRAVPTVDTHVHLFERGLTLAPDRRYSPAYDALPKVLLGEMERAGIDRAVVIQPSFLGTDNSYLLGVLARAPDRFAGVAVVGMATRRPELEHLRQAGVVGVRINCIGKDAAALDVVAFARLADELAATDLVLEIQAEGHQWRRIAPELRSFGCPVVVDHFGRTHPGDASGGFEALLDAAASSDNVWFKFSAPYRLPAGAAVQCAGAILKAVGTARVIWGSDWPWTQFEQRRDYRETLDWLSGWVPEAAARHKILTANVTRLFARLPAFNRDDTPGEF